MLTGKRRDSSHTFFGRIIGSGKPVITNCPLWKKDHPVWSCEEFKKIDVQGGGRCAENSRCGIDGCQKTHNRALHGDQFVNGGSGRAREEPTLGHGR